MHCEKYDVAVGTCQSRMDANPCPSCAGHSLGSSSNPWPYGRIDPTPGFAMAPEMLGNWKDQLAGKSTSEYVSDRHGKAQVQQIEAVKRQIAEFNTKFKFQTAMAELDKLNRRDLTTVQAYIAARLEIMNRG